jgi:hypothetical protein
MRCSSPLLLQMLKEYPAQSRRLKLQRKFPKGEEQGSGRRGGDSNTLTSAPLLAKHA